MRVISVTIFLVYCKLLVPPLCFCINCPLERLALDLSHPPTLTLPPPSLSVTLPAFGMGAWPPLPLTPTLPPPNTDGQLRSPWMGDENCGGEAWPLTPSLYPHTQFSSPILRLFSWTSVFGGRIRVMPPRHKLVGWPTKREWWGLGGGGGWGLGLGARWYYAPMLLGPGEAKQIFWALRERELLHR